VRLSREKSNKLIITPFHSEFTIQVMLLEKKTGDCTPYTPDRDDIAWIASFFLLPAFFRTEYRTILCFEKQ
jgi:hypothetical protein